MLIPARIKHLRINLNQDGTAQYYKWCEDSEDYDFENELEPVAAMQAIANGATADVSVLNPDNACEVYEAHISSFGA